MGLASTTAAGGSGGWRPEHVEKLPRGAVLALIPDDDDAGQAWVDTLRVLLADYDGVVEMIEPASLGHEGGTGRDISDWLDADDLRTAGDVKQLPRVKLLQATATNESYALPMPAKEAAKVAHKKHVGHNSDTVMDVSLFHSMARERLTGRLRLNEVTGHWLERNEAGRWERSNAATGLLEFNTAFCEQHKRLLLRQTDASNPKSRQAIRTKIRALSPFQSAGFPQKEQLLALSESLRIPLNQWDRNPETLGVPSGVIDLKTGELRSAAADEYITLFTSVDPQEREPLKWLKFLDEATGGDNELIEYLRRWCGYLVTGYTREHKILVLYGTGGTGKSTFVETIAEIMGDYRKSIPIGALAGNNNNHREVYARLVGARAIISGEPSSSSQWRADMVKSIAAGDTITANHMRQNSFDFSCVGKLMISANHAPRIEGHSDSGLERRLQIVGFHSRPETEDVFLRERLVEEGPAILNWMVEAAGDYLRLGLQDAPTAIKRENKEFVHQNEPIAAWREERLHLSIDPYMRISTAQARTDYAAWHQENVGSDVPLPSNRAFGIRLKKLTPPVESRKIGGTMCLEGYRLGVRLDDPSDEVVPLKPREKRRERQQAEQVIFSEMDALAKEVVGEIA